MVGEVEGIKMTQISIIVPTYNHCEDNLRPCLESIVTCTNMEEVEIIVVANGCVDKTSQFVTQFQKTYPSVKLLEYPEPLGFTRATNMGIIASSGNFIVLLNDDTVLLPQIKNTWINMLLKPFDDQTVGVTGPVKFTWDCYGIKRTAISFWCAMVRRTLVDKIGMLDEIFNPGTWEDADFCIKAAQLNYNLIQVPVDAQNGTQSFPIFHREAVTFIYNDQKVDIMRKNNKIIEDRYGSRLEYIYRQCLNFHCDINELFPVLREYASKCSHITEMGVRGVFSTYAFLVTKPNKMISYDIYTSQNIYEAIDVAKKFNIDFKFIEQDVLKTNIEITDMLFIDTKHTRDQLSAELNLHSSKVRKYIAMHDTFTYGKYGEVYDNDGGSHLDNNVDGLNIAIGEFLATNKNWKIAFKTDISNGLTILERIDIPKFSIIIPTYNHCEEYLKPCIDSLIK